MPRWVGRDKQPESLASTQERLWQRQLIRWIIVALLLQKAENLHWRLQVGTKHVPATYMGYQSHGTRRSELRSSHLKFVVITTPLRGTSETAAWRSFRLNFFFNSFFAGTFWRSNLQFCCFFQNFCHTHLKCALQGSGYLQVAQAAPCPTLHPTNRKWFQWPFDCFS